jgi:hypothetical protein
VGAKQVFFALAAFGMVAQPIILHPIHGTTFGANDFHGLLHFTPLHRKTDKRTKAARFSNKEIFPSSIYSDAPASFWLLFYQFFMLREKPKNQIFLDISSLKLDDKHNKHK